MHNNSRSKKKRIIISCAEYKTFWDNKKQGMAEKKLDEMEWRGGLETKEREKSTRIDIEIQRPEAKVGMAICCIRKDIRYFESPIRIYSANISILTLCCFWLWRGT